MSAQKNSKQDDALFKQACPACDAMITLDPAMDGHQLQCPKCLNEFTCQQAVFETEVEDSPAPPKTSRRLSATDRNLHAQVTRLKQQIGQLETQMADLQIEKVRTADENSELQRKLEAAQKALQEFSNSVLKLIDIQEQVHQLGTRQGLIPGPRGSGAEGQATARSVTKKQT